jgi:hypothetical protein
MPETLPTVILDVLWGDSANSPYRTRALRQMGAVWGPTGTDWGRQIAAPHRQAQPSRRVWPGRERSAKPQRHGRASGYGRPSVVSNAAGAMPAAVPEGTKDAANRFAAKTEGGAVGRPKAAAIHYSPSAHRLPGGGLQSNPVPDRCKLVRCKAPRNQAAQTVSL